MIRIYSATVIFLNSEGRVMGTSRDTFEAQTLTCDKVKDVLGTWIGAITPERTAEIRKKKALVILATSLGSIYRVMK